METWMVVVAFSRLQGIAVQAVGGDALMHW